ncbi:CvpA family protein [Pelolinea submarina]|jgi:uncharacterized membrane protein required for colicin V production|uniref:Colicin V production protein n=1 Tax=Pelolinea submarina TaxID=913107 RepID=A0A347ZS25_9CHLR|nr:CvpA family protein [Pelolinea submarina]REG11329.1 colicin V production protein [Pelolinea submarina]BBB48106.1 hypothetical protein Pelsub_P1334 [Pelolinea submarina]
MVSLNVLFYLFVLIFALIGAIRGWAKETVATFSVFLALFIISVFETYVPGISTFFDSDPATSKVIFNSILLSVIVFAGYQTPNLPALADNQRFMRDRLQDTILGLIIGALNGYMIFGSIWYFIHAANYPFSFVLAPIAGTSAGEAALKIIPLLPPAWLGVPAIYFAVAIAFIFVLVVFI